ncbi:MAG: diguanylate cyclase [Candidatus Latescibacteria bacterium]|nr:diguanylate cyclase [Candidatus Latescibacterota bacterium]
MSFRVALLCLILVLAMPAVAAVPPVPADWGTAAFRIGAGADHVEMDRGLLAYDAGSGAWLQLADGIPNFGYTDRERWLAFRIAPEGENGHEALLAISYPLLDEIELYTVVAGLPVSVGRAGDREPFARRPLVHRHFLFPLAPPAAEPTVYLLRVRTSSSLQVPLSLWDANPYFRAETDRYAFYGFFYGAMVLVVLYNAFLFAVLRERVHLAFVAHTGSFLGLMAGLQGLGYQYLWPNWPWLQEKAPAVFVAAATGSAFVFAHDLLGLRERSPRCSRLFRAGMYAGAACLAAACLLPYAQAMRPVLVTAVLGAGVIAWGGLRQWRDGGRSARWFIAAWLTFLLGTFLMITSKFGLLPRTFITENGPLFGLAAEAALLSLALAGRYREHKTARRAAQAEVLRMQQEANRVLKQEVQLRTAEMQNMMRLLAQANEESEQRNHTDGLTGSYNRRAFDDRLDLEFGRALRESKPVAMLMVDIDHFKNFNDTYGHLVGDECLEAVAMTIEHAARRTTDFVARYGGEEFAVIIPDATPDRLAGFGERVRQAVADMEFLVEGRRVPVTVSVGGGALTPAPSDAPEELIRLADGALYRAKHAGRNRVETEVRVNVPS